MGGVPASLGGGGLEIQRDMTRDALRARGHTVFDVAHELRPREFDVLHAFGCEPDVWHTLKHWRKNPAPLVVSPVLVVAPGWEEAYVKLAAKLPWRSLAPRMRREVLQRADLLIALTSAERVLLDKLAPRIRVAVIGNGVEPRGASSVRSLPDLELPSPYVLLLGTISPRKRQLDTIRRLGDTDLRPIVVGGFDGDACARVAFERAVADVGGRWLGEISDKATVRELVRHARALIHLSSAEGQSLSVLEALAEGTPVVCGPLPSNLELKAAHPKLVSLCHSMNDLAATLASLPVDPGPAPIQTWDDVAGELECNYRGLLNGRGDD